MPEIAEVETVRRALLKQIINKKISGIDIHYSKTIINQYEDINQIVNQTFQDIKRIGKWLIFELNDYYLLSHLRMEGKYFLKNINEEINKHEHVVFHLENNIDLRYHDTRKFGRMMLIDKSDLYNIEAIKKQGIEANSKELNAKYLKDKMIKKHNAIKTSLLDQTIISGLGNIYADEVLFVAKINPLRPSNSLSMENYKKIVDASFQVITDAIRLGGTTIKSYTSSLGVLGGFQNQLKVHKKEGEPCCICQSKIIRIKVNGRSTYYCPNCQK